MKRILSAIGMAFSCLLITLNVSAQVPVLNSDPAAKATIFLDFDGQYVTGTSWNWSGPIAASPANLSGTDITEIFIRVAEDYRPFTVNVTTDSTRFLKAPVDQRMRMIVTASSAWYGRAGGVAFVGSFSWGDDTPGWIFSDLLGNNPKYVAEAVAHEAGHTLGLQHQSTYNELGVKTAEYNPGTGNGEIGWAPIMGVGYYRNLTTWHTGSSSEGAHVIQNDLSIITSASNGITFREDDFGNTPIASTPIQVQGTGFQISGQITNMKDVDAFKIILNKPNGLRITAIPQNVGTGNLGADVDLKIYIINSRFDTVGIYNPSELLDAVIDTTLNQGTYYITIGATENAYHSEYGSLGYYSLAGSLESILPIYDFTMKAESKKDLRSISWSFMSDEKLASLSIETSADGTHFQTLSKVGTGEKYYQYRSAGAAYYRMKATTLLTGVEYYSNVVRVNGQASSAARIMNTLVKNAVNVTSNGDYAYQLFNTAGAMIGKGRIRNGYNSIDVSNCSRGMILLQMTDGANTFTEKLIKE